MVEEGPIVGIDGEPECATSPPFDGCQPRRRRRRGRRAWGLGGEAPEPGDRYSVPLNIHCGMEWLYVGGEPWQRADDSPDTETGGGDDVPSHWAVAQQTIFGFVTLVADDLIEYSIGDGEVIATYAPATQTPPRLRLRSRGDPCDQQTTASDQHVHRGDDQRKQ